MDKHTHTHTPTYRHVLALAHLRSHSVGSPAAVSTGVLFGYRFKLLQKRQTGRKENF